MTNTVNLKLIMSFIPKWQLISMLKELQDNESAKLAEVKAQVLQKDKKIKELEDQFGVTRRREWETRKLIWWMMWLSNNEIDAYEYLMRFIHKELLELSPISLLSTKEKIKSSWPPGTSRAARAEVPGSRPGCWAGNWLLSPENNCSLYVNIYGMKHISYMKGSGKWEWELGRRNPAGAAAWHVGKTNPSERHRKPELITYCKENQIKYKSQWKKDKIIHAIVTHIEPPLP